MKNKKNKGQYGYRDYHKRVQMAEVIFGAVMIAAQLLARNFTDNQAMKNVLTIMAILSVLPTANVASPLIAAFRYRTPPDAFYRRTAAYEQRFTILYDLLITSKERIMPLDAVLVHPTGVYAYCTDPKVDAARVDKFFSDMFAGHRLAHGVKLIFDEKAFFRRLESFGTGEPKEPLEEEYMRQAAGLLKSLSM